MHHYGGGYSDIKHLDYDWQPFFEKLEKSEDKYAIGYPEHYPFYPTCHQERGETPCRELKRNYKKIMGAGQFIHKKGSPLTTTWIGRITKTLDFY